MNFKLLIILSVFGLFGCENEYGFGTALRIERYTAEGGEIFLGDSSAVWECYQYAYIPDRDTGMVPMGTHYTVTGNVQQVQDYVDSASSDWDTCWCDRRKE